MNTSQAYRLILRNTTYILLLVVSLVTMITLAKMRSVDAACAPLNESLGKVTLSNVSIKPGQEGTYQVWVRMMAPDTNANSVFLEINDTNCGFVVGDKAKTGTDNGLAPNQWGWVNYRNTTPSASPTFANITVALGAGNHTIFAVGRESGVKVDRIILTQSTSCIPDNIRDVTTGREPGDNCVPRDTTSPTVNISSPATSPSTISGNSTVVQVTADDDISGVNPSSVKLCVMPPGTIACPTTLISPDSGSTSSPFNFTLDTSTWAPGDYTIRASAADNASPANLANSTNRILRKPDATAPTVVLIDPTAGEIVQGTTTFTATVTDNVGVQKVEFLVDNVVVATINQNTPLPTSTNATAAVATAGLSNGTHVATAKAFDAANNSTISAAVNFAVNNITQVNNPPTAVITNPQATPKQTLKDTVNISCLAADSGTINNTISKVEFFIDDTTTVRATDTTASDGHTMSIDTKTLANGDHTFYCKAFDNTTPTALSAVSVGVVANINNIVFFAEDINQDGCVNAPDYDELSRKWRQSTNVGRADINKDGTVNAPDYDALSRKWRQCLP